MQLLCEVNDKMKKFNNETAGYKDLRIYKAFKTFFDAYLVERDYDKTLSFMEEDFYSFGTGGDEVAANKSEFIELLKAELEVLKEPLYYNVKFIHGKEVAENVWSIFAGIEVKLPNVDEGSEVYSTRFTGCFALKENGFVVASTHLSESSFVTGEREFLPINYISNNVSVDKDKTEKIIFDIMSKAMPGGVVAGYAEEGFPLYFVNEKYLEMLGYSSYEEYYKGANGLGISHIHPDDVEMVNQETMHSYSTDRQYAIEYRIKHKDGHYIHVYDIGKKMILPDGKAVIVCVLYDMTEEVKLKNVLIQESIYDALTGLYNRRGLDKQLEKLFAEPEKLGYSAFIMIDADGLKGINDTYGHDRGDIYLKKIANIINNYGIAGSVASRQGGDEYVLFLYDYDSEKELIKAIESLQYIQNHNAIHIDKNKDISVRFSMGYSLVNGCTDYHKLLKEADEKMYQNKLERRKIHSRL